MQSAVERGLTRREATVPVRALGIDGKSFKSNHHYITVLSNLDSRCVRDVVKHRTEEAAQQLVSTVLTEEQRHSVETMCMDMWKPFMKTATHCLPQAEIVHDRFHLMRYLNEAVDKTRRSEAKRSAKQHNPVLKGSKYLFLKNPERLTDAQRTRFEQLKGAKSCHSGCVENERNLQRIFYQRNYRGCCSLPRRVAQQCRSVIYQGDEERRTDAREISSRSSQLCETSHYLRRTEGLNALIQEINPKK